MRVNWLVAGLCDFGAMRFIIILEHTLCLCIKRVYSEAVNQVIWKATSYGSHCISAAFFSHVWFNLVSLCSSSALNIWNMEYLATVASKRPHQLTWEWTKQLRTTFVENQWESLIVCWACSILLRLCSWRTRAETKTMEGCASLKEIPGRTISLIFISLSAP